MKKTNKKAFSIIEILVWMIIFLVWMTWIFSIINSNLNLNLYNKNYIIWVNLAKEQLELFRNLRDTNFKIPRNYIMHNDSEKFEEGKIYKISNDFSTTASFPIEVELWNDVDYSNLSSIDINKLKNFQICLDSKNIYNYCDNITWDKTELRIYRFIKTSKIWDWYKAPNSLELDEAIKVTSVVVWYSKRYQKFEVEEIFTNYKN